MTRSILFLVLILSASACQKLPFNFMTTGTMMHLDSTQIDKNSKIDKLIAPYKSSIDSLVSVVVGYNAHPMFVKKPESDLGDLLADYLLKYTNTKYNNTVDLALFNSGGFRIPLPPGAITVGHIMQLMPFDNTLVVMTLSGTDLQLLAEQIISKGGDPIAGRPSIQLVKEDETITILINDRDIDPRQNYRVLTSSYLAEGGDGYSVFLKGVDITDTGILIRDAIQQMYQRETSKENPASKMVEGRILLNP